MSEKSERLRTGIAMLESIGRQLERELAEAHGIINSISLIPAVYDRAGIGDGGVRDAVIALSGALISAEAELARMELRVMDCVAMNEQQAVILAKCQAELSRQPSDMVLDAARYRWLRSDARLGNWMVMQWLSHLGKYERVKEEKINDYIDSAMKP